MQIDRFFPTLVGSKTNPDHDNLADPLIQHCLELSKTVEPGGRGWLSNDTYNTSNGQHDVFRDEKFDQLNQWVKKQIHEYANQLDIATSSLVDNGAWFNIYHRHNFQEVHVHPTSVISAIYILSCPKNGARVFLNSPVNDMYHVKKTVKSQDMVDQIICSSVPGTLIVFPSYLPHAVEQHQSDEIRISLSYNFKQ